MTKKEVEGLLKENGIYLTDFISSSTYDAIVNLFASQPSTMQQPLSYWSLLGELKGTMRGIVDLYNPTEEVKKRLLKRISEIENIKPHFSSTIQKEEDELWKEVENLYISHNDDGESSSIDFLDYIKSKFTITPKL